jgi:L-alanine-DL-glutamate epimerase-like enolase superfamily enzyme
MKVESIGAFPIRIRANESLRGGTFSYAHYMTVLVKAKIDGVEGWGEAMTRFDPEATSLMVKYLGKFIAGSSYEDVRSAWLRVWRELRLRGHTRGVDVEALSGIELALQDCAGKLHRKPVSRLFAKSPDREVPVFAGSLFSSRGPIKEQVGFAKGNGLIGAKVKIGFGVEEDRETLEEVRREWDDGMLVADANGAYDAPEAARACAAFSDLDLAWFEEPVPSDDLDGYASLKRSKVTIGAGETWFAGDFETPIRNSLVGVIEPSVSRCGGLGVEIKVARAARRKGIKFSPMTGMNSAVSLAASLHAASACPSLGVEYNPFVNPLQTELATGIGEPRRGKLQVPTKPGLGIEIDERFVKRHAG